MGAVAGKFAENGTYVADKAFMTVFLNHEIRPGLGVPRAHGTNGAFLSQWTVHLNSLQVKWGEDLVRRVLTWNGTAGAFADTTGIAQFNRFCSADLPPHTGFYNPATGQGFDGLHLHERRGSRQRGPRLRSRRDRRRQRARPTNCPTSASSRGRTPWRIPTPATRRSSWASMTRRPARSTSTSATSRITAIRLSAPACRTARCMASR